MWNKKRTKMGKKIYKTPHISVIEAEVTPMLETSADTLPSHLPGCTDNEPAQLKRLLPFLCQYNELETDIKINLKKGGKIVYNFRTVELFGVPFDVVIGTSMLDDNRYCCDYTFCPKFGNTIMIYYNIYDEILFLLRQIREKKNGVYTYKFSNEVKRKVPTLVKLFANLEKTKKAQYGMPYIDFIDEKKQYTLLAVAIKADSINSSKDMDKIHIALFKIFAQIVEECDKAGFLEQTRKQMTRNLIRIGMAAYRISN